MLWVTPGKRRNDPEKDGDNPEKDGNEFGKKRISNHPQSLCSCGFTAIPRVRVTRAHEKTRKNKRKTLVYQQPPEGGEPEPPSATAPPCGLPGRGVPPQTPVGMLPPALSRAAPPCRCHPALKAFEAFNLPYPLQAAASARQRSKNGLAVVSDAQGNTPLPKF